MGLTELMRNTFISGYAAAGLTPLEILACIGITCLLGLYIFMIYRNIPQAGFYERNFNISLIALAVITAAIILTIQSNIVVSLGMVGALSIVRFRTAIKDPLDLVFLFWSISVGIICGAGFALIAVIASAVLTVIVYAVSSAKAPAEKVVLVINLDSLDAMDELREIITRNCSCQRIKAKSVTRTGANLAVEEKLLPEEKLLEELLALDHVISASLVEHEGDIV